MKLEVEVKDTVKEFQYAVRGPIPDRAKELAAQGKEVIFCNIGNPNAFEDLTIPHFRRVLSAVEDPNRLKEQEVLKNSNFDLSEVTLMSDFELDLVNKINGGIKTRAYTDSRGAPFILESVRNFISQRDNGINVPSIDNIFLTNGASEGGHFVMSPQIVDGNSGIMIPRPQYPFYSAEIVKQGGQVVYYDPVPKQGWKITSDVLEEAHSKALSQGINVKLLTIINPQNPTGAVATKEEIEIAVNFANNRGIGIMFDEVYQDNTYGKKFISGAKVADGADIPIYAFHSASKGFIGACGDRGGYLTIINPPKVEGEDYTITDVINKVASQRLCPNTAGQKMVYLMLTPPAESDGAVFEEYIAKRDKNLGDMEKKGTMLKEAFNSMEGVQVHGDLGAMYIYPELPEGVNDFDYAMNMLEKTGLCAVNGAGFGKPGYLRIAFLPRLDQIEAVVPKINEFHMEYLFRQ